MDFSHVSTPTRQVVRLIGSGGMGVVYEAWDTLLERRVALKVLHPYLTVNPANTKRFLQEARLAARIEHPNVVRIYRVDEHEGQILIEMQFCPCLPLHQVLSSGPLDTQQAGNVLGQVLQALSACHAQKIIHCDLKPGNLLVAQNGHIHLTDFGISRALYDHASGLDLSVTSGPVWGTPQYCPPEAWEGASPTVQWDLYALGVLMHESLTGVLPFNAKTPALLMRDKLERPHVRLQEVLPGVSPALGRLIDQLKERDPKDRPTSAEAALELLQATPEAQMAPVTVPLLSVRIPEAMTAGPSTPRAAVPGLHLRKPDRNILFAVMCVFLLAAAALAWRQYSSNSPATFAPMNGGVAANEDIGVAKELFSARDRAYLSFNDGSHGRELWVVNAAGEARMVEDIESGPGSSDPSQFMPRPNDGGFFFTATKSGHGEELYFCGYGPNDYSPVWPVREILQGSMSSLPVPWAAWEGGMIFSVSTLHDASVLYYSTGSRDQTGEILDPAGNLVILNGGKIIARYDEGAYFVASDGKNPKLALWNFDYKKNAVKRLLDVPEQVGEMMVFRNKLYLTTSTEIFGHEMFVLDPQGEQVNVLADLQPGVGGSFPAQLFVWNDRLYFQAQTKATGVELWVTDGTEGGTVQLRDIEPGIGSSDPAVFVPLNEYLFFQATGNAIGKEIWRTDGTTEGTLYAADVLPGVGSSNPYHAVGIGNYLFFTANDGAHGEELWMLDTTDITKPAQLVEDL